MFAFFKRLICSNIPAAITRVALDIRLSPAAMGLDWNRSQRRFAACDRLVGVVLLGDACNVSLRLIVDDLVGEIVEV